MKAFPTTTQTWDIHNGKDLSGMDLRDYFAARAMQGYMSRQLIDGFDEDVISEMSYKVADAMMKARNSD
jgi:hypothetical protein